MSETKNLPKFTTDEPNLPWVDWIEDVSKTGAWVWYSETNVTWWSKAVFEIYQISKDNIAEIDLWSFYNEEMSQLLSKAIESALTTGSKWNIELKLDFPDGRAKWIRSIGSCSVLEGKGKIIIGSCQDITLDKKLKSEMQTKSQFLESILRNIPDMIFVKEAKDLKFVLFNKAGEEMLGVKNTDLIGKNDYDFFPKEQADNFVGKDNEVLRRGEKIVLAEEPISPPHGDRILRTKKIPLNGANGLPAYLLGISEDITDLVAQKKLILDQQAALQSQARLSALGEMAAGIAHEINNPLSIILGISSRIDLMLERKSVDQEKLRELTTKLDATTERIATIVSGLRDFSREGVGDPYELIQVSDLIQRTMAFCNQSLRQSSIETVIEYEATSILVYCQQVKFSQVLINLINNARDAVANTANPRIKILVGTTNDCLTKIEVIDNGPGVTKNIQARILEPFFTTKEVGKGTGLGLSISKGIIESQNGQLYLDSDYEDGAKFVVILPQRESKELVA